MYVFLRHSCMKACNQGPQIGSPRKKKKIKDRSRKRPIDAVNAMRREQTEDMIIINPGQNQTQNQKPRGPSQFQSNLETQLVDAPYPPRAAEPTTTLGNHAETVEALFAGGRAATDIPLLRPDGVSESTRPTGGVTPAALAISGAPVDRDGV